MNREIRSRWANETVAICNQGGYMAPGGRTVHLAGELERARAGTVIYSLENPPSAAARRRSGNTQIEVRNETTFEALQRLANGVDHVACLNFASATNPGRSEEQPSELQSRGLISY